MTSPDFLALSFAPMPTESGKSRNRSVLPVPNDGIPTRKTSDRRGLSASSTDEDAIAGPELPPLAGTAKRLFLVRHGEVINPGGDRPVYYGALDVPLSPLGEAEARAAASYLQQFDIDLVVSSPLSRAVFGATEILGQQQTSDGVLRLEGFRELDRGSWCGMTKDEIGPETMARFDACDESATPEGGESYTTLKRRVLSERDAVLERLDPGQTAAVVSHLQVTRSVLSDALGVPTAEMAGLPVATASVTCVDYDDADGTQTVHFRSFKPDVGLAKSKDGAN